MELGAPELIIILVVVLLLFGPGRIAKIARELGSGINQFKKGLGGEASQLEEPDKPSEDESSKV